MISSLDPDKLDFEKGDGLINVVVQDARNGKVLTVAFADREAIDKTIETREMHLRSRTRGAWLKGETSGNTQRVVSLLADCDGDAVLARVVPAGPACHEGTQSCFGDEVEADALSMLDSIVGRRAEAVVPEGAGYTQSLLADRNLRLKKIGEESAEFVLASADNDVDSLVEEAADIVYHVAVGLRAHGKALEDVRQLLWERSE